MTYTPDYIRLSTNPDVLASGAQRINANFDDIAFEIVASINGLAYQNPVISAASAAPASPELGDRYIVSAFLDEQDPWYGHIDEIAEYVDIDTWEFYAPSAGWCCTVLDEGQQFVYNEEQWNPLPVLVTHNDLASLDGGTDGEYYHTTKDTYDALAGTGTPTSENKFVTADSLLTDITTHAHDGVVTAQVDYGDLDNIPSTFTPASHTHSKTDVTDFTHTHTKTDITDFDHASGHIKGTGDEIDGDKLDIDFNPSYYVPGTVTEADNVDHLSAHLHGIDLELNSKSDSGHAHVESDISDLGSYSETGHAHSESDISDLGDYAPLVDSIVPTANLGSGTADDTTYLRGDQTWAILASGNTFAEATAGEAIAQYDVVYVDVSDSNKVKKASCDGTSAQSDVLGMATDAMLDDASGEIIVSGTISNEFWSWTPNKWLFLSSTAGVLSQTAPTINGQYAVPVGLALSATEVYIQPMTGWIVPASSGTAAGSDTQLQYNDGGAWAGAANLTWNKTTNRLALNGTSSCSISTLTDGSSITPDFNVANNFTVTLGGNRTLANPTNITAGQSGLIFVVQDGTGSRTLAYGTYWHFPGGTDPTASTAANAVDVISYFVRTSTSIVAQMMKDFK